MTISSPPRAGDAATRRRGDAATRRRGNFFHLSISPSLRLSLAVGLGFFLLALWPRLSLPPRLVTADEDGWLGQTGNFAGALANGRLEQTYQRGHPGTTALWASLGGLGFERAQRYAGLVAYDDRVMLRRAAAREPTFVDDLTAARRGHALVNALLVAGLGLLAWRLVGLRAGLLAGGLLALDPFLVAHAQVIRMDSLQAGFLGLGLLAVLIRWTGGGSRAYLLLAGVAFGLALVSKTSSLLVALPLVLCVGWQYWRRVQAGQSPRRVGAELAGDVALLGLAALAAGLIALPALLVNPIGTVGRILDYAVWNSGSPPESGNFFLGRAVPDPGPLFYPLALLFRVTPLALAGLLALALLGWRRRNGRQAVLVWLAVTAACFGLELTLAPKKADRYLLPVWPVLLVLAAIGLDLALRRVRHGARLATGLVAILLATQVIWLPPLTPYALAYYNPLLGGAPAARQTLQVGWGEGLEAAAAYLNGLPNAAELAAATLYAEPFRANFLGRGLPLGRYEEADYLVHYVNMEQRELLPPDLQAYVAATPPAATVDLAGIRYAAVYPLPKPEFGGALRIDQYLLESDADTRGERLRATLRWTPLAPAAADWRIRLELLDARDRVASTAEPPPRSLSAGEQGAAELTFRLPDARGTLHLGLRVVDAHGNPILATLAPPWARHQAGLLAFPSITVRVR